MPKPRLTISYDIADQPIEKILGKAILDERMKGSLSPTNKEQIILFHDELNEITTTTDKEIKKAELELSYLQQTSTELSKSSMLESAFKEADEKLKSTISQLQKYSLDLNSYKNFLQPDPTNPTSIQESLTYIKLYKSQHSYTMHFGINVATMRSQHHRELLRKDPDQSKKLQKLIHPIEIFMLREAIAKLEQKMYQAVLIDIFSRDKEGNIKPDPHDREKPDIHTIVLYVQAKEKSPKIKQIIIIDPTNSDHSTHITLKENSLRLFLGKTEPIELTPSYKAQPYTIPQKGDHGPQPHQYRDCTDIAVKIAFNLNRYPERIDPKNLDRSEVIFNITNRLETNQISEKLKSCPFRIKQTSDLSVSRSINSLLNSANKLNKLCVELNFTGLAKTIDDEITDILQTQHEYQDYLKVTKNLEQLVGKQEANLSQLHQELFLQGTGFETLLGQTDET